MLGKDRGQTILRFGEAAWEVGVDEDRLQAELQQWQDGQAKSKLSPLERSPGAAACWKLWTSGRGKPPGGT